MDYTLSLADLGVANDSTVLEPQPQANWWKGR